MNRVELYLDIASELTRANIPDNMWPGDSDSHIKTNEVFNLILKTKDPELAWNLLKIAAKEYEDFFYEFQDISEDDLNNHIDYIKGSCQDNLSKTNCVY